MSKLKIWMNGKKFWFRVFLSSAISEFVLCCVAYTFLFIGLRSFGEIWGIIVWVWLYKLVFAFVAAPFVSWIGSMIKKLENSDVYDYNVNYNPFLYNNYLDPYKKDLIQKVAQ